MANVRSVLGPVPQWVWYWFLVSGVLVVWDSMFVLHRPDSLPGGRLHHFFPGYDEYVKIDWRYADPTGAFYTPISSSPYYILLLLLLTTNFDSFLPLNIPFYSSTYLCLSLSTAPSSTFLLLLLPPSF